MQAIILAGGMGTRLRPVVSGMPKSLAPIRGVPFIQLLVRNLVDQGVAKIVVAAGYLAEQIVDHFVAHPAADVDLSFHCENAPLGTGGAIFKALELLDSKQVFVLNGDTYVDVDLNEFGRTCAERGAPLGMCVIACADTSRYGAVSVANGWVCAFGEKSSSGRGLINAGVYAIDRELIAAPKTTPPFSFEHEVIAPLVRANKVAAFETTGRFIDIGVPEDLASAQRVLGELAERSA